jgi:PAS domain S-box-containing protein
MPSLSQADLHSTRAYLAAIVESSDDAIISKDLQGIVRSFNPAAERLFGYAADEIIGRSITLLLPPERLEEEARILATLRRGEKIDHFETVRIAKDGRRLDISLSVSPVRNEEGTIIGAAKIARDITEQKRAAQALAEQREWFATTLASIGDGVIATDVDGRVVFMNSVAETLTGSPLAEARGRPCADVFRIVNEHTRRPVVNPVIRVLAEGVVVGLANHTILIAADGTERPIDDSGAPIITAEGRVVGAVLVFRDVSERRKRELERQASAHEREQLLESERNARSDAERANRIKDDFVAMVSHELRTPLGAILGWTQLLEKQVTDDRIRHGLDVIERNARMQSQLVSDLLDISRISSGKLLLDVQSVDLADVVKDSMDTLQQAASAKSIAMASDVDPTPITTMGDPARLRQVVWNLVSNAIKFTPEGGRVDVHLRRIGSYAELAVSDTGAGIRPEDIDHLFERFRQVGSTTTRRYGGLGLGLSIAKHIVDLHGGAIRVASAGEGRGARFTVELPLRTAAEPPIPRPSDPIVRTDAGVSLAGITVLVVEDELDMRTMMQMVLERHDARVVAAASAREALEAIRCDPDVLVSDIRLPDMDGYDLITSIRSSDEPYARIPAIALTAFARTEDRTRAIRAGFQGHLAKPFEATELILMVASFANIMREDGSGRRPHEGGSR